MTATWHTRDGEFTVKAITLHDCIRARQEFRLTDRHGYLVGGGATFAERGRIPDVVTLTATLARLGESLADLEEGS